MQRAKLVTCLAAAAITFAGATSLATPAAATELFPCSPEQQGYARGYADGSCGGSGTVDSCEADLNGGFTFSWSCD